MGLISEPLLFVLALIDTGSVLFLLVYFPLNSIYNLLKICLGIFEVNLFNDIAVNLMAPYLIFDVFKVITLSDLECDYLNAQQCCSKLNKWVVPKLIAHSVLEFLLLTHGQLILCLVNLPMTLWLLYEYFGVPSGNMGVYDPAEIHNRGQLKRHARDCMIHLGYYLIFFFIYLYCMIIALLKGDPINRNDEGLLYTN